ncbi:MAG: helix-turn-helix domain-containing protein [Patescibacteria group bacterium]
MTYENALKNLGFSSDEADVYKGLLQLGTQPASIIARHLGKKRTTVRVYLEHLVKEGFARFHWKGSTQYFTAEKPEEALESLHQNKARMVKEFNQNIRAFSAAIPELTSITRQDVPLPKITFYEGAQNLKKMYLNILTSKTEVLALSSIEDLLDLFGKQYDKWFVKKRAQKRIPLRYIAKESPVEKQEEKKDPKFLRKSRHFPAGSFDISNEINIYDGKVSIITLKNEKIGLLIQSDEIYRSMKILFELLWKTAR